MAGRRQPRIYQRMNCELAERMRELSYHFPPESDAAEQLLEFADEPGQRARDLEAGGSRGRHSVRALD
jgi:hypothetical protein